MSKLIVDSFFEPSFGHTRQTSLLLFAYCIDDLRSPTQFKGCLQLQEQTRQWIRRIWIDFYCL